ncbi:FAD-dependent oxidoreductase [Marmoricola sp. RAF53]|uniref:FAD-dependent oxidoreductase n=1 Tax=Marmoricola sp. RAF53 TaxID=3233059 RepID=UPI003F98504E
MREQLPVVVVGAGLAGLACAHELAALGHPVLVLESTDRVGGRVVTDVVDGFTVDRGFQVLSTAYPALGTFADLDALALRRFPRGVRVRRAGALHEVPHPLASPAAPYRAARSGATDLRGKAALARYAAGLLASSPAAVKRRTDVAATQVWGERLPEQVVRDVLVPFMSGVVLDPRVRTSRVFTDLMMRMFVRGASAVPAAGMQRLPEQVAGRLPAGAVRLESPVVSVSGRSAELADGTTVDAAAVVVAADPWAAQVLVPDLGELPPGRGVTTYYFAAEPWSGADAALAVDADGSGVANSVVLTATAPEYSRDGRALIATSVFHDDEVPYRGPVLDVRAAEEVARELHRAPAAAWEPVTTRHVPYALPAMPAPLTLRKPTWFADRGVWVAGDHRDTSSIQGALVSGARVARSVARSLRLGTSWEEVR